jgi:hypothetical protein
MHRNRSRSSGPHFFPLLGERVIGALVFPHS